MTPNATLKTKNIIPKAIWKELNTVTDALDSAFLQYDIPISWIMTVADLLTTYKLLTGKDYEPKIKPMEDTII